MGQCLLILGMHRSGTSAMTGALGVLGAYLGDRLMPPREGDNEAGFFEDLGIYELHNRVLERWGYTWDDPRPFDGEALLGEEFGALRRELAELLKERFAGHSLWAIKDPRLSVLMPLWTQVLQEVGVDPRCIIMGRQPSEVAASLARRNGFSAEKSAGLWLQYNLCAEHSTRGTRRVFVSFEKLIASPSDQLKKVGEVLSVDWHGDVDALAAELRDLVRPEFRHQVAGSELPDFGRFAPWVPQYQELLDQVGDPSGQPLQDATDRTRQEVRSMNKKTDELLVEHMTQLFHSLRSQVERLEEQLAEVAKASDEGFKETAHWLKVHDEETEKQRQLIRSLEAQLEERTEWLKNQEEEGAAQNQSIQSIEEQLGERTEWLQIQSKSIEAIRDEIERLKRALKVEP